jgi:hypothetical protein
MSSKDRKQNQRREYHAAFNKKIHHGHGGLWVKRKETAALGGSSGSKGA